MNNGITDCQGPWLRRWVRRLANDLFLSDDLRAHARGWTVEPILGGCGRRYRDPRWDRVGVRPAAPRALENTRTEPIRVAAERLDLPLGEDR